jgi:ABC-type polysaccharide/polyol phosphate transport system ATPase subunit
MSTSSRAPAICVEDVCVSFARHAGQILLRNRVKGWLSTGSRPERFQALRGVSFQIGRGEAVAIVGHNGAGKSTLLNLVTGVCRPRSGRIAIDGRVAALLELGSGFHPDLTGIENVRINAALLGLSRQETRDRFDEIVDFANIGEFINEPLRTYSSGMMMRLAFSVAVNVDPDILVVDEVLGVGDEAFSIKCVERIKNFRRAGKTLLCVSHALTTLEQLCERAIWLDHGQVAKDGPIRPVLDAYSSRSGRETFA